MSDAPADVCAPVRPARSAHELDAAQLRLRCEPASLQPPAESAPGEPAPPVLGQGRAVEAIGFGLEMKHDGFNVFVLGQTGSGRARIVRALVDEAARHEPVPSDRCYVNNFEDPRRPSLLTLPPGQATRLRDHMDRFIDELHGAIPAVFESQSYRERKEAIEQETSQRHERDLEQVAAYAQAHDVAMVRTPTGFALAPLKQGEVIPPEAQEKLGEEERQRLQTAVQDVHDKLHEVLKRVPLLQREQRERERVLDRDVTSATVDALIAELRRAFSGLSQVEHFLAAVEADIMDKAVHLLRMQAAAGESLPTFAADGLISRESPVLRRYRVNVMVDHKVDTGAPVVLLDHPTITNLVGRVEHLSHQGVLVTDFNLIKSGALHLANGGYLIVDAYRLLSQPFCWDQLKRALRSRELRIESPGESLGLLSTVSQEPEPMPLDLKVVLIGEPWLYYRLSALDPELGELFKVVADFEEVMPRSPDNCRHYAALLTRFAADEGLPRFSPAALARVIEESSRVAADANKLSLHVRPTFDLLREAGHFATRAQRAAVAAADVERALAARERRQGRLRDRVQEVIGDDLVHVETDGAVIGQINALSVVQLVETGFGFPSRVTAQVRLGKGEVVDIVREVNLGGPIHSKGVITLAAFLGGRYLPRKPLSLRATLSFEQTYGTVEGDSASLAELLALLSALGRVPISQSLAVTGAIDQHGRVQAVGGLHEKVEGFFEVCAARTLSGTQGVILPRSSAGRLMLRSDVVDAVQAGRFHVYAVEHVDEAIELSMGAVAGARGSDGRFAEGSVNARVEAQLEELASAALAALGEHKSSEAQR